MVINCNGSGRDVKISEELNRGDIDGSGNRRGRENGDAVEALGANQSCGREGRRRRANGFEGRRHKRSVQKSIIRPKTTDVALRISIVDKTRKVARIVNVVVELDVSYGAEGSISTENDIISDKISSNDCVTEVRNRGIVITEEQPKWKVTVLDDEGKRFRNLRLVGEDRIRSRVDEIVGNKP